MTSASSDALVGAAPAESEYELERRSGRLRLSPARRLLVRVRRPARVPRPPLARRLPTSPPRSRRAPAGAGVEDGGHPRVSSVRVLSVGVCSLLEPSSKAAGGGARGGGMVPSAGGWVCQQAGGYGLEVGCARVPYHTPQKVQTQLARKDLYCLPSLRVYPGCGPTPTGVHLRDRRRS